MSEPSISPQRVAILGDTMGVGFETACQFAERGTAACQAVVTRVPDADVGFVTVNAALGERAVLAEAEYRFRLSAIDVLVCASGGSEPPRPLH